MMIMKDIIQKIIMMNLQECFSYDQIQITFAKVAAAVAEKMCVCSVAIVTREHKQNPQLPITNVASIEYRYDSIPHVTFDLEDFGDPFVMDFIRCIHNAFRTLQVIASAKSNQGDPIWLDDKVILSFRQFSIAYSDTRHVAIINVGGYLSIVESVNDGEKCNTETKEATVADVTKVLQKAEYDGVQIDYDTTCILLPYVPIDAFPEDDDDED